MPNVGRPARRRLSFWDYLILEGGVRSTPRPSKYPPEFRQRSVRVSERPIAAVAHALGIRGETLRISVRRDKADDSTRSDRLASAGRAELTALRRKVRGLRRFSEIPEGNERVSRSANSTSTGPISPGTRSAGRLRAPKPRFAI